MEEEDPSVVSLTNNDEKPSKKLWVFPKDCKNKKEILKWWNDHPHIVFALKDGSDKYLMRPKDARGGKDDFARRINTLTKNTRRIVLPLRRDGRTWDISTHSSMGDGFYLFSKTNVISSMSFRKSLTEYDCFDMTSDPSKWVESLYKRDKFPIGYLPMLLYVFCNHNCPNTHKVGEADVAKLREIDSRLAGIFSKTDTENDAQYEERMNAYYNKFQEGPFQESNIYEHHFCVDKADTSYFAYFTRLYLLMFHTMKADVIYNCNLCKYRKRVTDKDDIVTAKSFKAETMDRLVLQYEQNHKSKQLPLKGCDGQELEVFKSNQAWHLNFLLNAIEDDEHDKIDAKYVWRIQDGGLVTVKKDTAAVDKVSLYVIVLYNLCALLHMRIIIHAHYYLCALLSMRTITYAHYYPCAVLPMCMRNTILMLGSNPTRFIVIVFVYSGHGVNSGEGRRNCR